MLQNYFPLGIYENCFYFITGYIFFKNFFICTVANISYIYKKRKQSTCLQKTITQVLKFFFIRDTCVHFALEHLIRGLLEKNQRCQGSRKLVKSKTPYFKSK